MKKRCPRCSSFLVKKIGFKRSSITTKRGVIAKKLQRYLCNVCQKSFTLEVASKRKRHSKALITSAIKRYVEDNTTLRPVSNSIGISPKGLLNWLMEYGSNAKSPLEVARELKPKWSGLLGVDGKAFKIHGQEFTILVAQDVQTFDPVFFSVVERENVENAERFFLIIRDVLRYPIKGIVSDLGRGKAFVALIKEIFTGIPHQACIVHFFRYVNATIPKSKKSVYYQENCILRQTVKGILFAENFNDAEETFQRLLLAKSLIKTSYHKKIIRSLTKHFDLLTAHFHHSVLVRDNNVTENLIKQLNRKFKQSGGFKNIDNAYNFLKLWFIYYRLKPFCNSSRPYRNGKTPIELANAKSNKTDWLTFSQRNRHT